MVSIGARDEPVISSPVAVLIGPGTGSSGEMTAIAVEHRPNSRFFGQATLGTYNSVVQQHILTDGTLFGIVQALGADRTGHVYDGPIVPDVLVRERDDPVKAAVAWLLSTHHGAPRSVAR
jgi:C-terminal processing protease CtpA/Prc